MSKEKIVEEKKDNYKMKKVNEWSIEDVGEWIDNLTNDSGFKQIWKAKFKEEEITGKSILCYNESDLEKLGFKSGRIKEILNSIDELKKVFFLF
jgi:hypothetical protein